MHTIAHRDSRHVLTVADALAHMHAHETDALDRRRRAATLHRAQSRSHASSLVTIDLSTSASIRIEALPHISRRRLVSSHHRHDTSTRSSLVSHAHAHSTRTHLCRAATHHGLTFGALGLDCRYSAHHLSGIDRQVSGLVRHTSPLARHHSPHASRQQVSGLPTCSSAHALHAHTHMMHVRSRLGIGLVYASHAHACDSDLASVRPMRSMRWTSSTHHTSLRSVSYTTRVEAHRDDDACTTPALCAVPLSERSSVRTRTISLVCR